MAERLLSAIQSPSDIKQLSSDELVLLAEEIRLKIIETMSSNGGHLASNLGAVELTLALHKAFSSPKDKLIWDVSHQTYAHKLVTGRKERFHTIRTYKGLSGFSNPKESPHDHFHAGHAGTALSLALGCAIKRDLTGGDEYIIPILGDATLTCGMSLEALNNIPSDLKRFIIILNDNAMSISKNVGAITHILSRFISNPITHKLHEDFDALLSKFPYGNRLKKHGHKITESLKNLVSPAAFFEQYGLSYIGPIDGHDPAKLIAVLESLKQSCRPVMIHVLTNKGQGMPIAMQNPVTYHGAKPFNLETGKFHPTNSPKPTFPKVFGSQIVNMAERDPGLITVTPAMPAGSCLAELMNRFPERCLDVGIAEGHAVTFSGGLAHGGEMRVLCSIYSTFLQRAFDNLFHDVCLQELPVVFAIDRGGISGPDGSTHHGIYDLSFLNAMPNMVIAQPRDGKVLRELLESAFSYRRPTAIRYPNMPTEDPEEPLKERQLGKGELLIDGDDLLIISLGHMNATALDIRKKLLEKGLSAAVFDPIFIKPLDSDLLCDLLIKHRRVVTLEEHALSCGLGAILNHFLLSKGFSQVSMLNMGIPEAFVEHGGYKELIAELGLTTPCILKTILRHFQFEKAPA